MFAFIPNSNSSTSRRKRRRTSINQLSILNHYFSLNKTPNKLKRLEISKKINLDEKSIQIWFQNKRQSLRKLERGVMMVTELPVNDSTANIDNGSCSDLSSSSVPVVHSSSLNFIHSPHMSTGNQLTQSGPQLSHSSIDSSAGHLPASIDSTSNQLPSLHSIDTTCSQLPSLQSIDSTGQLPSLKSIDSTSQLPLPSAGQLSRSSSIQLPPASQSRSSSVQLPPAIQLSYPSSFRNSSLDLSFYNLSNHLESLLNKLDLFKLEIKLDLLKLDSFFLSTPKHSNSFTNLSSLPRSRSVDLNNFRPDLSRNQSTPVLPILKKSLPLIKSLNSPLNGNYSLPPIKLPSINSNSSIDLPSISPSFNLPPTPLSSSNYNLKTLNDEKIPKTPLKSLFNDKNYNTPFKSINFSTPSSSTPMVKSNSTPFTNVAKSNATPAVIEESDYDDSFDESYIQTKKRRWNQNTLVETKKKQPEYLQNNNNQSFTFKLMKPEKDAFNKKCKVNDILNRKPLMEISINK